MGSDLHYHIDVDTNDAQKNTHALTEEKRNLIAQLKVLRHELPGVGELLHLVRHPIVAGSIAVKLAIDAWHKYREAVHEAATESQAIADLIKPFRDFAAGAVQARLHAESFAISLGQVGREAGSAAQKLKELSTEEADRTKLEDEKKSAAMAFELANIKLRQKQDPAHYSQFHADRDEAGVRLKYQRQEDKDRIARMDREVALKETAATHTGREIETLEKQHGTAGLEVEEATAQATRQEHRAQTNESVRAIRREQIKKHIESLLGKQGISWHDALDYLKGTTKVEANAERAGEIGHLRATASGMDSAALRDRDEGLAAKGKVAAAEKKRDDIEKRIEEKKPN